MAVLRSDIIIPEVFTPYVIEQTTARDAFLASGVVAPMAELNATEGGDFVNVPFFSANLSGDFEVLSDSSSLTPGKISTDKQVGVILHRGRAFESRDLAALAAGSDPMAAIGQRLEHILQTKDKKIYLLVSMEYLVLSMQTQTVLLSLIFVLIQSLVIHQQVYLQDTLQKQKLFLAIKATS